MRRNGQLKLNADLVARQGTHPYLENGQFKRIRDVAYCATPKKLHDRLSDKEIDELVTAFKTGTAKHLLTKLYAINIKSVKRPLREQGVK